MPSKNGAETIAANMGGVAGQWLRGQLQPLEQHPPEGSAVAGLCDFVLAQASPIPAMGMDAMGAAGAETPWSAAGMALACRGEDIVAKTNISPITMRAQCFAMAAI